MEVSVDVIALLFCIDISEYIEREVHFRLNGIKQSSKIGKKTSNHDCFLESFSGQIPNKLQSDVWTLTLPKYGKVWKFEVRTDQMLFCLFYHFYDKPSLQLLFTSVSVDIGLLNIFIFSFHFMVITITNVVIVLPLPYLVMFFTNKYHYQYL